MAIDGLIDPKEDPQSLGQKWNDFLSSDENRSSLLQFGLAMMQPVGIGQSSLGHIGQAIGAGAEASGRVRQQDIELEESQAKRRREAEEHDLNKQKLGADIRLGDARLEDSSADRAFRREAHEAEMGIRREDLSGKREDRQAARDNQAGELARRQRAEERADRAETRLTKGQEAENEYRNKDLTGREKDRELARQRQEAADRRAERGEARADRTEDRLVKGQSTQERQNQERIGIEKGRVDASTAKANRDYDERERRRVASAGKARLDFEYKIANDEADSINNSVYPPETPANTLDIMEKNKTDPARRERVERLFRQEVNRGQQPAPGVTTERLSDPPLATPPVQTKPDDFEKRFNEPENKPLTQPEAQNPKAPLPQAQKPPAMSGIQRDVGAKPNLQGYGSPRGGSEKKSEPAPQPAVPKPKASTDKLSWKKMSNTEAVTPNGRSLGKWKDVVDQAMTFYNSGDPQKREIARRVFKKGMQEVGDPDIFKRVIENRMGVKIDE